MITILLFSATITWEPSLAPKVPDWRDLFYFSAATYTATGYGDLTPFGNMRLFATVEALTGLIMIAWTASFAFLVMQRYWQEQDRERVDSLERKR